MTRDDLPKSTEERLQALEQTVKQLLEVLASMQYDDDGVDLDDYKDDVPYINTCSCKSCLHMTQKEDFIACGLTGLACNCVYCNPGKE